MKRRTYLKNTLMGSMLPLTWNMGSPLNSFLSDGVPVSMFSSQWHLWPDMKWVGPEYWGNRLQDWELRSGKVVCNVSDRNRSLHLLSIQNSDGSAEMDVSVAITKLNSKLESAEEARIGFRIGAKGPIPDYRSSAVFGDGLDICIDHRGQINLNNDVISTGLSSMPDNFTLALSTRKMNTREQNLVVKLVDVAGRELFISEPVTFPNSSLEGNIALLAHVIAGNEVDRHAPSVSFSDWEISSDGLKQYSDQSYGPICFAQYTVNRKKLKLTAQFAPIEEIEGHVVRLQFKRGGQWETSETTRVDHPGRAINFQFDNWDTSEDTPYRLLVDIPLKDKTSSFEYEGTICREPLEKDEIVAAVFSCNFHHGFPDQDIVRDVIPMDPDMIFFLGDQFYEGTGGFSVSFTASFDKACLDYLRKWMMFGWSYREIFRHKPCAIIPDDHDVWHGNIWGESGKKADTSKDWGAGAQDSGGYKMDADWVNMVQFTQTSHLPDAYDPTPVKQGISVYYTHWNYAGISLAILEDRKFKSAPKNILPPEAEVWNGWIQNDEFDIKEYKHLDAELLGPRQEKFLEDWVGDWSEGACLKVVLSQTNFATCATIPKEAKSGAVIPGLPVPEKGEYVLGDKPTVDMDSNGWPSSKRDKAVSIIRKGFAFHIAGDQHLATFIHYGLDEFGDSGHAFAGPALNNIWPRRFWPPTDDVSGHTYEDPAYVGNHYDGFGNRMTVKAVGNPYNGHKEPKVLHDRSVGYGMVRFNKEDRTITTECYKRFHDPTSEGSQYPGWPITISQEENYGRKALAYLPAIELAGEIKPVVSVYDEKEELVYALRMKGSTFRPKVFSMGRHTVILDDPDSDFQEVLSGLKPKVRQKKKIRINSTSK